MRREGLAPYGQDRRCRRRRGGRERLSRKKYSAGKQSKGDCLRLRGLNRDRGQMCQKIDGKDVREHEESESNENRYVEPSMRCYMDRCSEHGPVGKNLQKEWKWKDYGPSEPRSTAQASTARSVLLRVQSLHREEHQALIHVGW